MRKQEKIEIIETRVFTNPFEEVVPLLFEKLMGIIVEKKQEVKEKTIDKVLSMHF